MSVLPATSDSAGSSSSTPKTYTLFSSSSQTIAIKLDRSNYLVWESLVLPLIEGNKLESHIDGTARVPPRLIPDGAGTKVNADFEDWYSIDRLLVGWLRNTMTQDIAAQLLHCRTTQELWSGAHALSCASTKAHIMVYKAELHQTCKNDMKIEEYLTKMKNIADQLALVGAPVNTEDLILHTLNGLDTEYNAIIVKLVDQLNLTWVEAQASLLAFESRLEQLN